jgi:predicted nucleotidyltransferase
MLNKTHALLEIFAREPWREFTFKEVKKLSKNKSESYVYNTLNYFVKEQVLIRENAGNVVLYKINHNSKASAYLGFVSQYSAWMKRNIPFVDIEAVKLKVPTNFFTMLITGSYARGEQKKDSDIDLVVIGSIDPKKVYAELNHVCDMSIPKIHLYVFTETEFLRMLLDKKPNYGKEAAKNNLIIHGGEAYYRIIMEAVDHGFNG